MSTKVIPFTGVRKRSLVLVKGGRGKVATPSLTDGERYPRFPPAWVDWLILGLGLAALNLPSPIPLLSLVAIVVISLVLARRVKKDGGEDPNVDSGVSSVCIAFFTGLLGYPPVKRPLERQFPKVRIFDKQLVVFVACEAVLYLMKRMVLSGPHGESSNFLSILLFVIVVGVGFRVLLWWDTSR